MDHLIRPLPWPSNPERLWQKLYELGEKHYWERLTHQAVRHKDAGDPPPQVILGHVYQVMCGFSFLMERGDFSEEEALELLGLDWTDLPKEDKLALSPFKLCVRVDPNFKPEHTNIYIGNKEDTTPDESLLLAVQFDVPTRTPYFWGWMVALEFHRVKKPIARMVNQKTGKPVDGVLYLETWPPMSAPLLLDLNRRRMRRRA